MFIAAQFTILWSQPRCPPTDEWITKLWEIHTMEFYSVIKKNRMASVLRRWKDLENIMLSEVSQTQKEKSYVFSNMPELGNIWVARGTPDNGEDHQ